MSIGTALGASLTPFAGESQNTIRAADVKPKKKFVGPKPLPSIIDLARDQPLFVPPVTNQLAKLRKA